MKLHCIGCGKECDVPVERLQMVRVMGCTECAKRDDIKMVSAILRGEKTEVPMMTFEEGISYPPAVFSSSVEEWKKKCDDKIAEQDAKIAAAYPLRGSIDGVPVMARWEIETLDSTIKGKFDEIKKLIGGIVPQKELVALGMPGEIRNANFPDFWINVRLDSRDSFVSNGAPKYKTGDEYIDTPPCIMRRESK